MPNRLTTAEFVKKAKQLHGEYYNYSYVDYKTAIEEVLIICPKHGRFRQKPTYHLNSKGCPSCGKKAAGMRSRISTEEFIRKAKGLHGDRYEYSLVIYEKSQKKVKIRCNVHNYSFEQTPNAHLSGNGGCLLCKRDNISLKNGYTTEIFINKAQAAHDDFYDYSNTEYSGDGQEILIRCKLHGEFKQKAGVHLQGHGCFECGKEKIRSLKLYTFEKFIELASFKHKNRYIYSKDLYKGYQEKTDIFCKKHGIFQQKPSDHVSGNGCPVCAGNVRKTTSVFISDAISKHGDKYDYSESDYKNHYAKVKITCPHHGTFWQSAGKHTAGGECQKCHGNISKQESLLADYTKGLIRNIRTNTKKIISPYELDIYIPEKSLAIEYCGLYWHSESRGKSKQYHLNKLQLCQKKGINLLTIFEDEWLEKRKIVESVIKNKLGFSEKGIYARNTNIQLIDSKEANDFFEENHLQGRCKCSVYLGAYADKELIAVMGFGHPSRQSSFKWELKRYTTDGRNHPGVASKIFQYFARNYDPDSVVSFADLRWSTGNLYQKLGFHETGITNPDYYYVKYDQRYHKSSFRKAGISRKFGVDMSNKTEREAMHELGFHRIWDCGKLRFVWNKSH